jgi:hypothetical protein
MDIIDLIQELDQTIVNNPMLEFLIIIKLIIKKCMRNKRRITHIEKLVQEAKPENYSDLFDKIISLLENSTLFVNSAQKYLLTLGIKNNDFFNEWENSGMRTVQDIVQNLKKNKSGLKPEDLKVALDFMIKILNKFI